MARLARDKGLPLQAGEGDAVLGNEIVTVPIFEKGFAEAIDLAIAGPNCKRLRSSDILH